jgi:hypothetical protein
VAADYQTFAPDRPRFLLATYPTPPDRARRLEDALRVEGATVPCIYLKRDDLLSLALGGNKVRNLEFSLGHALAEGATDVITSGRLQSNQCRLTAAGCARAGLTAHLVFSGPEPRIGTGNQILCRLLGAKMYYAGSDDRAVRDEYVRGAAMMLEGLAPPVEGLPDEFSDFFDPRESERVLAAFRCGESTLQVPASVAFAERSPARAVRLVGVRFEEPLEDPVLRGIGLVA